VRSLKHLVPLLVLAALGVALWQSGLLRHLSWASLAQHQTELLSLVAIHPLLAGILYVLLYTVVVALSVPEAALGTVAGGLLFGPLIGGALAVVGATFGAVILFLVARTAFADLLARRAGTLIEHIRPGLHRDGFSYLLALRLIPVVPFWLLNVGAALCGMRLVPYTAATLIGIIPATFVFAWIGSGVGTVLAAGGTPNLGLIFSLRVLGPLLALAALSLTPVILRRYNRIRG
jgi:uncharacterized membrane protein YdjX (TVP38/TMEM64 family)